MAAQHSRRRHALVVATITLIASACGANGGVDVISATPTPVDPGAEPAAAPATPSATTPPVATDPTGEVDDPAAPEVQATLPPVAAPDLPAIIEPELNVSIELANVVNIDAQKPPRDYDEFVAVAFTDIERWWSEVYPTVYREPFEPLEGGVYAGYPERETDIPGCGADTTTYEELVQYVAFYCQFGDFMVYDDGDTDRDFNILAPLATEFGPAVLGIVLAHEYGHAIQGRIGALDRLLATIITEQQADCFAGAWTGQAYRGESPLLRLGDADVRAGLIAMLSVRDPVGTDQFVPGGHGSAFDRVGAFQVGFVEGPARCAELIDEPLTLMPNAFQPGTLDQVLGGNAPYDCEELRDIGGDDETVAACTPAPVFLADDLNHFWSTVTDGSFPELDVLATRDLDGLFCTDPVPLADEAVLCPSANTLAYDEPAVLSLYREFGDFTLGYFYGIAWAEQAQRSIASPLTGEQRALLNDCFTGAWVRDITPDRFGQTPRQGDRDGDGIADGISSSPGDLDEAIRMAILQGDRGANIDIVGTPFEKIAALRVGVLGGIDACNAELSSG